MLNDARNYFDILNYYKPVLIFWSLHIHLHSKPDLLTKETKLTIGSSKQCIFFDLSQVWVLYTVLNKNI